MERGSGFVNRATEDRGAAALDIGADTHEPTGDLDPERDHAVANLSAPVFGKSGKAVLQLSLYGLPVRVSGRDLAGYRDGLLAAADRASRALSS